MIHDSLEARSPFDAEARDVRKNWLGRDIA